MFLPKLKAHGNCWEPEICTHSHFQILSVSRPGNGKDHIKSPIMRITWQKRLDLGNQEGLEMPELVWRLRPLASARLGVPQVKATGGPGVGHQECQFYQRFGEMWRPPSMLHIRCNNLFIFFKRIDYGIARAISHFDLEYDLEEVVIWLQLPLPLALEHQGAEHQCAGSRVCMGRAWEALWADSEPALLQQGRLLLHYKARY